MRRLLRRRLPRPSGPACGNGSSRRARSATTATRRTTTPASSPATRPARFVASDPHVHSRGCERRRPRRPPSSCSSWPREGIDVGAALVWGVGYDDDRPLLHRARRSRVGRRTHPPLRPRGLGLRRRTQRPPRRPRPARHRLLVRPLPLSQVRALDPRLGEGAGRAGRGGHGPRPVLAGCAASRRRPCACCMPWEFPVQAARGGVSFLITERRGDGPPVDPGTFLLWRTLLNSGFRIALLGRQRLPLHPPRDRRHLAAHRRDRERALDLRRLARGRAARPHGDHPRRPASPEPARERGAARQRGRARAGEVLLVSVENEAPEPTVGRAAGERRARHLGASCPRADRSPRCAWACPRAPGSPRAPGARPPARSTCSSTASPSAPRPATPATSIALRGPPEPSRGRREHRPRRGHWRGPRRLRGGAGRVRQALPRGGRPGVLLSRAAPSWRAGLWRAWRPPGRCRRRPHTPARPARASASSTRRPRASWPRSRRASWPACRRAREAPACASSSGPKEDGAWYSTALRSDSPCYSGVLPRPSRVHRPRVYRHRGRGAGEATTAEHQTAVVAEASACAGRWRRSPRRQPRRRATWEGAAGRARTPARLRGRRPPAPARCARTRRGSASGASDAREPAGSPPPPERRARRRRPQGPGPPRPAAAHCDGRARRTRPAQRRARRGGRAAAGGAAVAVTRKGDGRTRRARPTLGSGLPPRPASPASTSAPRP